MPVIKIWDILPDPEALLALAPEELAGVVIQCLNSLDRSERSELNRYNFSLPHTVSGYPHQYQDKISRALMEAWVWLEREGLLAPEPGQHDYWVFITRRGQQITKPKDLENYRRGNLLPRQFLNPRISQKVWASFLRGDYDTAVFQAFKEVEVRVREAGHFNQSDLGVLLMRKAIEPSTGPLTDNAALSSEQEAISHLFAGAIGLYKNPSGFPYRHREQ